MTRKDIRIFYSNRSRDWIIANDYKLRRLMSDGYSFTQAKHESHGHLKSEELCEKMKETILANKKTKSRDLWILGCYVRICDKTYKHYKWICGLHSTKENKDKEKLYRVGGRGI